MFIRELTSSVCGFLKIVFSKGWFCIKSQFCMGIFLRLRTDGWYVVTNDKICLRAFAFCWSDDEPLIMKDNILQKHLSPSAGYYDVNDDFEIPKTPEGIPPNDELDLLYNSKIIWTGGFCRWRESSSITNRTKAQNLLPEQTREQPA